MSPFRRWRRRLERMKPLSLLPPIKSRGQGNRRKVRLALLHLFLLVGLPLAAPFRGSVSLTPRISTRRRQSTSSSRLCLSSSSSKSPNNSNNNVHYSIQVCQNKDCCQKWLATTKTPLPVILQDLLQQPLSSPQSSTTTTPCNIITIESTGCLSQCDKGPNLSIVVTTKQASGGGKEAEESQEGFIHGVSDPTLLADALQEYFSSSTSTTSSLVEIPTTLRAAVKVMEQTQKAKDPAEQDRFLSSVIRVLVQATTTDKEHGNVPLYTKSSALARAYALRAQARLEQGLADDALQDAMAALEIVSTTTKTTTTSTTTAATATSPSNHQWIATRVYRTMVDAYEAKGQIQQAIDSLQQWAVMDPTFSTKIAKEMARLRQSLLS